MMEDEMFVCHHQLNGHESEQTLRDSEGQDSLVCCNPWITKSQTWLLKNNNFLILYMSLYIYIYIYKDICAC